MALTPEDEEQRFLRFHDALSTPEAISKLERAVADTLAPYEQHGLLEKLPKEHNENEGNQQEIVVLPKGDARDPLVVKVSDVLIGEADWLKKGLAERLDSPEVAERIFTWLRSRLPTTLTLDRAATKLAKDKAVAAIEEQQATIPPGDVLAARQTADGREHCALGAGTLRVSARDGHRTAAGLFAGGPGHVRRAVGVVRRVRAPL